MGEMAYLRQMYLADVCRAAAVEFTELVDSETGKPWTEHAAKTENRDYEPVMLVNHHNRLGAEVSGRDRFRSTSTPRRPTNFDGSSPSTRTRSSGP
jgi:hypothetical protein